MVRRAGLDECGKSRPPPGSDPRPSGPWRVIIPTALSRSVPLIMAQVNGFFFKVMYCTTTVNTLCAESGELLCVAEQVECCGGEA